MLLISTASRLKVNWAAHGLFYLQSPLFHPITTPPQAAHITSAQSRIHGETVLLSCSAENNSCSGRDRSDCFLYFHITSISPNLSEVKGWGDANWGEPTKGGLRNSLKVNILLPDSNWMKLGENESILCSWRVWTWDVSCEKELPSWT